MRLKTNPSGIETLYQTYQIIAIILAPILLYDQLVKMNYIQEDKMSIRLRKAKLI